LAERLLIDVIGLEWELVHDEACRWEHVMSENVERKLIELLDQPRISPFGMPVPGLELLGLPSAEPQPCDPISGLETGTYQLVRIGEPLQIDSAFLLQLWDLGLTPGEHVTIDKSAAGWLITGLERNEGLIVDGSVAAHLFAAVIQN
jgi:DtxR family Mn-dependent transcriptional regulator